MTNPHEPTEEPIHTITIDGKQFELVSNLNDEVVILKPLPKQPEEEKKQSYWTYIESYAGNVLRVESAWTPSQAQLAADAVRELLKYIQGDEKHWDKAHAVVIKARDALKDSE
jgi:hypothetical protein